MSIQTVTSPNEVGNEVQKYLQMGQKEILIQEDPDRPGMWVVTGDRQKFWGWLATPEEMKMLEQEIRKVKLLAECIPDVAPALELLIRAAEGHKKDN